MKTNRFNSQKLLVIMIACAIIPLLITACQPTAPSIDVVEETPVSPTVQVSESTEPIEEPLSINFELSDLAQGKTVETVAAVQPNKESPYWEIMPEHLLVTLEDYPVSSHLMKPQIFVYPVAELSEFNASTAQMVLDLQTLLNDQQVKESMPFLPLFNAAQVMHSQLAFVDFKNGNGVRFLTQFDQAPIPLNNMELIYTFQGLTDDGKYYIAAIFPINHPDLPNDNQVSSDQEFEAEKFVAEMAESVEKLGQLPVSSFTPDLSKLDTLIQSIEVK
ncbi:MAG: hypothetical protein Q7U53_15875 [Anaerolineaceae bacterium]|nr:hypothetical protein [Anaerolineaceae bacterium]